MALATPTISYTDGSANAAVNLSANATAYVTPGNGLTVTLQSSTGVLWAQFSITSGSVRLNGLQSPPLTGNGPFSWNIPLPLSNESFQITTAVSDGNNVTTNLNTFNSYFRTVGQVHRARGVVTTNESLTAFDSVSGGTIRDGVTYAQGDIVLLAAQTTASQNGLYMVGLVDTTNHNAPLTRVPDFATGTVFAAGQPQVCEVSEGTLFANTTWKITTAGAITVDTTSHNWYPRSVTQSVTLVAGTSTVANVPILSATKTAVTFTRITPNTASSTVMYAPIGGLTPGIVGTATFNAQAAVAAGTINASDVSTILVTVTNF